MPHFVIEVFGRRESVVEADDQISAIEEYARGNRSGDIVGVAARPMRPGEQQRHGLIVHDIGALYPVASSPKSQ